MNLKRRKLDNTAKVFSLESKKITNTFRLVARLNENIDEKYLQSALINTLKNYPSYKVRLRRGIFWDFFETNLEDPIVEEEITIPGKRFNFIEDNGYLFKVTYYNNKINLDIYHLLTDGMGALNFFKTLLYNYLNLKYKLKNINNNLNEINKIYEDEYLKNVNKKLRCKKSKTGFIIKEKNDFSYNKTYNFVLNLQQLKSICKNYQATISEYLMTIYILSIYKTIYDKKNNKDIVITLPIDLRKHYKVNPYSNFFTCVNIEGNVLNNDNVTFDSLLTHIKKEFQEKVNPNNFDNYLARDVKLGTNVAINSIPSLIKKISMRSIGKLVSKTTTTTFSNLGIFVVDEQYKKYINNVMTCVNAGSIQKVKCTVCSYDNNVTVTINSNLISKKFEEEFYNLLSKDIKDIKLDNNN